MRWEMDQKSLSIHCYTMKHRFFVGYTYENNHKNRKSTKAVAIILINVNPIISF